MVKLLALLTFLFFIMAAGAASNLTEEEPTDGCRELFDDLGYFDYPAGERFDFFVDHLVEKYDQNRLQAGLNIGLCEILLTPARPPMIEI